MKKNFYTLPEAAEFCAVGRTTMWRWVKSGKVKATAGPGGHHRIAKNDLHAFARENGIVPVSGSPFTDTRILIVDDGAETCRRIKDNPDTAGIRVLIMTGFDTLEHREQADQAGADGYLAKPIGKDVLLETVKALLSMPANS